MNQESIERELKYECEPFTVDTSAIWLCKECANLFAEHIQNYFDVDLMHMNEVAQQVIGEQLVVGKALCRTNDPDVIFCGFCLAGINFKEVKL